MVLGREKKEIVASLFVTFGAQRSPYATLFEPSPVKSRCAVWDAPSWSQHPKGCVWHRWGIPRRRMESPGEVHFFHSFCPNAEGNRITVVCYIDGHFDSDARTPQPPSGFLNRIRRRSSRCLSQVKCGATSSRCKKKFPQIKLQ